MILIGAVIILILIVAAVVIGPAVKMALDIAPFLYTNTRCSAKTGLILTKKTYNSLLAATYLKEVYAILEDTAYARVVEHANQYGKVSQLLDNDLYQTYVWLESIMPPKIKPIITAMKEKFTIQELKEGLQRVKEGLPVGELHRVSNANLRLKLEAASDEGSFATALDGTPYAPLLSKENVPTELDLYYLRHVLQVIEDCQDRKGAAPFKEYWRRLIDLVNIRLTLRHINSGEENLSLLEGGFLPAKKLEGITDTNQLSDALQGTLYEKIHINNNGLALEQELHNVIAEEGKRVNAKYPLKGGPVVKYIIQKELEIRNLNVILKLKEENFTAEEISALLTMP